MTPLRRIGVALCFVSAIAGCRHLQPGGASAVGMPGVVVEVVGVDSVAGRAGIRPGDILLSWTRPEAPPAKPDRARGDVRSPFDMREVEVEQAPRGPVTIEGRRGSERFSATLTGTPWEITARPRLSERQLQLHQKAQADLTGGAEADAVNAWRSLADELSERSPGNAVWVLARAGAQLAAGGKLASGDGLYASAIDLARQAGRSSLVAEVLEAKAKALPWESGNPAARPAAESAFREAVKIREAAGESLRLAESLHNLARLTADPRTSTGLFSRTLAIQEKLAPGSLAEGQTLLEWGRVVARFQRDAVTADRLLHRARLLFERLEPDGLYLALVLNELGVVRTITSDFEAAQDLFQRSLEIREKAAPGSPAVASGLNNLGNLAQQRGDMPTADVYLTRALDLFRRLTPGSFGVATAALNLGRVRARTGDFAAAETLMQESIAILEKLPGTTAVVDRYLILGELALQLGNTSIAEAAYGRALDILESVAPSSSQMAVTRARLGNVLRGRGEWERAQQLLIEGLQSAEAARDEPQIVESLRQLSLVALTRGEMATAETHLRRALTIDSDEADHPSRAITANILASVYLRRGDYEGAEQLVREALEVTAKGAPISQEMAVLHQRLAYLAGARGDQNAQLSSLQESLRLQEKLPSNPLLMADTLIGLASLTMEMGRPFETAEELASKARALVEQAHAGSSTHASALATLGHIAIQRKEAGKADELLAQALAIRVRIGHPADLADSYWRLGELNRESGRLELAVEQFARSIEAIETQMEQLGGSEDVRSGYVAQYGHYYRSYIAALLALKRPAEAFASAERSRARSLLRMLAERELSSSSDLDPELARARARVGSEYDRVQARIAEVAAGSGARAETDALAARLRELRDERVRIADQIRVKSPRFASLHYPEPLDVPAAQSALDPGTILLEYVVANDKTFLFVLQSRARTTPGQPALAVFTLPAGEAALREEVARFRSLIEREATQPGRSASLADMAGLRLYQLLVHPARNLVASADRILISPDGPLHALPFAALSTTTRGRQKRRFFIEEKPLHVVVSATVYAQLKRTRGSSDDVTVAAFGDPVYPRTPDGPAQRPADADLRALVQRGLDLKPLPASRVEVEAIGRLYGSRATVYTGEQATEERAKAVAPRAAYLHFAMHGVLDERVPLNSAIVFSFPGMPEKGENGLLQAWEILDQFRIDAELVTLSACETALGKELGGEGLVGLTRAFQYAGARSVLASLWSIGDESTATLMTRFYQHLRSGRAKDEALRGAQLDMIRGGYARPFHWAAFTLSGDWR